MRSTDFTPEELREIEKAVEERLRGARSRANGGFGDGSNIAAQYTVRDCESALAKLRAV